MVNLVLVKIACQTEDCGEFFELEDPIDIILILRRLSKILPSRFLIKVFFAEIKYGVHRSNGNICIRVVLFFFVVI